MLAVAKDHRRLYLISSPGYSVRCVRCRELFHQPYYGMTIRGLRARLCWHCFLEILK